MMVYVSAFCPLSMSLLFQTERESGADGGYSCALDDAAASQGQSWFYLKIFCERRSSARLACLILREERDERQRTHAT